MNNKMNSQLLMLSLSIFFVKESCAQDPLFKGQVPCSAVDRSSRDFLILNSNANNPLSRSSVYGYLATARGSELALPNGIVFNNASLQDPHRKFSDQKERLLVELARRKAAKAADQSVAQ